MVTGFPSRTLKVSMTHGRYGALNVKTPKNDILTDGFRLPQIYVIMNVKLDPKKWTEKKGATATMATTPNKSSKTKLAVRPLKSPSSNNRQYRTKKYMWNKKSILNIPKYKKLVTRRHSCPCWKIRLALKYSLYGLMRSTAHAAVVKKADVRYSREMTGMSMYLQKQTITVSPSFIHWHTEELSSHEPTHEIKPVPTGKSCGPEIHNC